MRSARSWQSLTTGLLLLGSTLTVACSSQPIDRFTPVFGQPDAVVERSGDIARVVKPDGQPVPRWVVDERLWYYERFGFVLNESRTGELNAVPMTEEDQRKLELLRHP